MVLMRMSGAGSHCEPMTGRVPVMGIDVPAKSNTVSHLHDKAAVGKRPLGRHRWVPVLIVMLTLGVLGTATALTLSALLVRTFADGRSGMARLVLLGGGILLISFVIGLLGEPTVTRISRHYKQRSVQDK